MSNNFDGERENSKFSQIESAFNKLKDQNISEKDILFYLKNKAKKASENQIPAAIFNRGLSPLQALVKYLFENQHYNFADISRMLNRDQRTIWNTYHCAKKLNSALIQVQEDEYMVDISIFQNRDYSFLENLCCYMKSKYSLNYHQIGVLLGKDDRTIWTVCKRAEKKNAA